MTGSESLAKTPLHALHVELGARMVPFAGYDMPVQYPAGILREHQHTRASAALFDVSHMGQLRAIGPEAAAAIESTVPADIVGLADGRQRYALFTTPDGGIFDDLMVSRVGDEYVLVVNAACKQADEARLRVQIGERCDIMRRDDLALLALQGPSAGAVLERLAPASSDMRFMDVRRLDLAGAECLVSRSGYSGEDGFEISVPNERCEALARALLAFDEVEPAGLGARDSLRLEAGLPLYGHDVSQATTPVDAGLAWSIGKARRPGGERAGGYPGAERIEAQLAAGAPSLRVGLLPTGRAPIREGAPVLDADGARIGTVTSGGFGPTVGGPVAMALLDPAATTTPAACEVRGKALEVELAPMPFVSPSYRR